MTNKKAESPRQPSELDKELGRWQKAIYELCKKAVGTDGDFIIDGGGCDSGDALDFTLTEIGQAFAYLKEGRDGSPRQPLVDLDLTPEMIAWLNETEIGKSPYAGTLTQKLWLKLREANCELREAGPWQPSADSGNRESPDTAIQGCLHAIRQIVKGRCNRLDLETIQDLINETIGQEPR